MAVSSTVWLNITPDDRVVRAKIVQFVPLLKVPAFIDSNSRPLLESMVAQAKSAILSSPVGYFQVRYIIFPKYARIIGPLFINFFVLFNDREFCRFSFRCANQTGLCLMMISFDLKILRTRISICGCLLSKKSRQKANKVFPMNVDVWLMH